MSGKSSRDLAGWGYDTVLLYLQSGFNSGLRDCSAAAAAATAAAARQNLCFYTVASSLQKLFSMFEPNCYAANQQLMNLAGNIACTPRLV
jgi:hypothetical protein